MSILAEGSDLSFYIHIPYCVKRCGYCDFNTYTPAELKIESSLLEVSRDYIELMLIEIEMARQFSKATSVPTIFFGGGTPSLMEPSDLARVIEAIKSKFTLTEDCEITLEANPDTLTKERLSAYRYIGINRLSIGMQSAVPHVLKVLDRTHDPLNISKVVSWAREVGFKEISLDLIYGIPGETMADWQETLRQALSEDVTHISAYALIVEQGTKLAAQVRRGEIVIPDDDETADKYIAADEAFTLAGFEWYELSNWSKTGSASRHNLRYWQNKNWWGIGPGAHSHIDGRRWWNVKHPTAYRERVVKNLAPMQDQENLTPEEIEREEVMLLIRIPRGLTRARFAGEQSVILEGFNRDGYFESQAWGDGFLTLSQNGRLVADRIVRELAV